jgi:hypothetical protein
MPAPRARLRWSAPCAAAILPCANCPRVSVRRFSRRIDHFATEVQRFFPVPRGSPEEAFEPLAKRYPVFELLEADAQ